MEGGQPTHPNDAHHNRGHSDNPRTAAAPPQGNSNLPSPSPNNTKQRRRNRGGGQNHQNGSFQQNRGRDGQYHHRPHNNTNGRKRSRSRSRSPSSPQRHQHQRHRHNDHNHRHHRDAPSENRGRAGGNDHGRRRELVIVKRRDRLSLSQSPTRRDRHISPSRGHDRGGGGGNDNNNTRQRDRELVIIKRKDLLSLLPSYDRVNDRNERNARADDPRPSHNNNNNDRSTAAAANLQNPNNNSSNPNNKSRRRDRKPRSEQSLNRGRLRKAQLQEQAARGNNGTSPSPNNKKKNNTPRHRNKNNKQQHQQNNDNNNNNREPRTLDYTSHRQEDTTNNRIHSDGDDRQLHSRDVDDLLQQNKLCLVLDIDHTLLNSVTVREAGPDVHEWLQKAAAGEATVRTAGERQYHWVEELQLWTKLRPGVREFLRQCHPLYELWIHTNGTPAYAQKMVQILDPDGKYFGDRVIAQGKDNQHNANMSAEAQIKRLTGRLHGLDAISVVVDDNDSVWSEHKHNLIAVERYLYFPSSRQSFGLTGPSHLECKVDEDNDKGMLMINLDVLKRLHTAVFDALEKAPIALPTGDVFENWDIRHVLNNMKQSVLKDVRLVFSRIIPLSENPASHPMWMLAEAFGAVCSEKMTDNVTHVVTCAVEPGSATTEKIGMALEKGKFVVTKQWLESSCLLWRRSDERAREFAVVG